MKTAKELLGEWRGKRSDLARLINVTPKAIWLWKQGGGIRMKHYEALAEAVKSPPV